MQILKRKAQRNVTCPPPPQSLHSHLPKVILLLDRQVLPAVWAGLGPALSSGVVVNMTQRMCVGHLLTGVVLSSCSWNSTIEGHQPGSSKLQRTHQLITDRREPRRNQTSLNQMPQRPIGL